MFFKKKDEAAISYAAGKTVEEIQKELDMECIFINQERMFLSNTWCYRENDFLNHYVELYKAMGRKVNKYDKSMIMDRYNQNTLNSRIVVITFESSFMADYIFLFFHDYKISMYHERGDNTITFRNDIFLCGQHFYHKDYKEEVDLITIMLRIWTFNLTREMTFEQQEHIYSDCCNLVHEYEYEDNNRQNAIDYNYYLQEVNYLTNPNLIHLRKQGFYYISANMKAGIGKKRKNSCLDMAKYNLFLSKQEVKNFYKNLSDVINHEKKWGFMMEEKQMNTTTFWMVDYNPYTGDRKRLDPSILAEYQMGDN